MSAASPPLLYGILAEMSIGFLKKFSCGVHIFAKIREIMKKYSAGGGCADFH
jgi:hypothetical protein